MAIVYRHRRLDNNKIFYVGIGKGLNRAYEKGNRRNSFWNKVTKKTDYQVEILYNNLTWEDACELEMLLIESYGRRDLGTGTLVNLTDGGEGTTGHILSEEHKEILRVSKLGDKNPMFGKDFSKEHRDKMSKSRSGDKSYMFGVNKTQEQKDKISDSRKGKLTYGEHHQAKRVVNVKTGEIYSTIKEVAELLGIKYTTLSARLSGQNKNNTDYIMLEEGGSY